MSEAQEYWNIPKADDVLSIPQGTNLTVFVDHADNSLFLGLGASDIAAIASVCIALMVLFVSLWQGFVTRKHNRLSVKPAINLHKDIIRVAEGRDGKSCLRLVFQLKNSGLGPAQNTNINLKIGGELVLSSIEGFRPDLCEYVLNKFREELNDSILVGFDNVYPPDINAFKEITLPPGGLIDFLEFDFKENQSDPDAPERLKSLISIEFEYEDLYGHQYKNKVLTP